MAGRLVMGWMIGVAFSLSIGCGRDAGSGRIPLHGSVQINGMLVLEGSVALLPVQGHSGPAASTSITNGRYAFTQSTGPVPGPHRVVVGVSEIDQTAPADANGMSSADGQPTDAAIKTAPAAGARGRSSRAPAASASPTQWEMEFDVPSEGDYRADLEFGTN